MILPMVVRVQELSLNSSKRRPVHNHGSASEGKVVSALMCPRLDSESYEVLRSRGTFAAAFPGQAPFLLR